MHPSKYELLCSKNPRMAAEVIGVVEKRNYLAHTIRDLEHELLRVRGTHYHIVTCLHERIQTTRTEFYSHCCEIFLAHSCGDMGDRAFRIALAHELGHVVYNLEKLTDPHGLVVDASSEEEIFAWVFAYHLIRVKSEEYKTNVERNDFVYGNAELKGTLFALLEAGNPVIRDGVTKLLNS